MFLAECRPIERGNGSCGTVGGERPAREACKGDRKIERRTFLQGAALAALTAAGIVPADSLAQIAVPNSSGTERPKLKAPPLACDCHHHIYDTARFPAVQRPEPNSRVVAVIHPTITDAELTTLARGGVRGIRFSLNGSPNGNKPITTLDMIEPLSKRVNELGWHVQINAGGEQILAAADLWNRIPSPIVFDHMGHIPQPMGTKHPAFALIRKLIDKGRTWVKLSVTYDNTKDGPPTYADVTKVAQAYVQAAPERMVWGSNWPHPNETNKPDDAVLFDLLAQWAPNEATRHRILVENPTELYFSNKV